MHMCPTDDTSPDPNPNTCYAQYAVMNASPFMFLLYNRPVPLVPTPIKCQSEADSFIRPHA